jgi:hypothetical protein
MKEPKDKRTKKYKEWKQNFEANKPKGVGDIIEDITTVTGIKAVVHAIAGDDCGCKERKEKLNKMFRKTNIECLNEEEYNYLTTIFKGQSKIKPDQQLKMKAIYERIFNVKLHSDCLSCSFISQIYNPLKHVYNA